MNKRYVKKSGLQKTPIAIIGLASIFPESKDLYEYWKNILEKRYCITDIPPSYWSVDDYFSAESGSKDKTCSSKGGFIPEIPFNPMEFGIPPNMLEATDVSQLLALVVAKKVFTDAGYELDSLNREKVGVILGASGGRQLLLPLITRTQTPLLRKILIDSGLSEEDTELVCDRFKSSYVDWQEGSFPGLLSNVISGRIANRLDLNGTNFTVDAACASSLAAVKVAISDLLERRSDIVVTGGSEVDNCIFNYMCFSESHALSRNQIIRPFADNADGTIISEGIGMILLKRLPDAEKDNDKIYAVIRGVGSSSDGKAKSIYAPSWDGQVKALTRAYEDAHIDPKTIGLLEAHGTGTRAGDAAEFKALKKVFGKENPEKQHIALGSVKSQIGHTKSSSGVAGIIKAVLSLYHQTLPATINVEHPHPDLEIEDSPFYLNKEVKPWFNEHNEYPRRAGVSAAGFGGTNFHIILEEHNSFFSQGIQSFRMNDTPRMLVLHGVDEKEIKAVCRKLIDGHADKTGHEIFCDLVDQTENDRIPERHARIGFLASSFEELKRHAADALDVLTARPHQDEWEKAEAIYYRRKCIRNDNKVVALFSGQGSQYLHMGSEILINFPETRKYFIEFNKLFSEKNQKLLTDIVYPASVYTPELNQHNSEMLKRTLYAQPAIGAFCLGLYNLLESAGFQPDIYAGHSFGEFTALKAAGVLDDQAYCRLVKFRGEMMEPPRQDGTDLGKMLAIKELDAMLEKKLATLPAVKIANRNSCSQIVLAGDSDDIDSLFTWLKKNSYSATVLPVSAAFHTEKMRFASDPFNKIIADIPFNPAYKTVFSNTSSRQYPEEPDRIKEQLQTHMLSPVLFKNEIENIYNEGGRIFVEFGPRKILSNLIKDILREKPHTVIALNPVATKSSDYQLRQALLKLKVLGLIDGNPDSYQRLMESEKYTGKKDLLYKIRGLNVVNASTKKKQLAKTTRILKPATRQYDVNKVTGEAEGRIKEKMEEKMNNNEEEYLNFSASSFWGDGNILNEIVREMKAKQSASLDVHNTFLNNQTQLAGNFYNTIGKLAENPALKAESPLFRIIENYMNFFHSHEQNTLKAHAGYLNHLAATDEKMLEMIKSPGMHVYKSQVLPSEQDSLSDNFGEASPGTQSEKKQDYNRGLNDSAPFGVDVLPVQVKAILLAIVSEKTGYPVETLDMDMNLETDLGIDSIKRVEIMSALKERLPGLPVIESGELATIQTLQSVVDYIHNGGKCGGEKSFIEPNPDEYHTDRIEVKSESSPEVSSLSRHQLDPETTVLHIVSEKTGFPPETLETEMDMETDLGIDSIKKVEIMSALRELFPQIDEVAETALGELRTLQNVIDFLVKESKRTTSVPVQTLEKKNNIDEQLESYKLGRYFAEMASLELPEIKQIDIPAGQVVIITDDMTAKTDILKKQFEHLGLIVVTLYFSNLLNNNQDAAVDEKKVVIESMDEEHIGKTIDYVNSTWGPVAGFIYLHPSMEVWSKMKSLNNSVYIQKEMDLVKFVFFAAKHLKKYLNTAPGNSTRFFITVTGLDGMLGLGNNKEMSVIGGGLPGLIKTLYHEWDSVLCRAIDLDPEFTAEHASQLIMDEIAYADNHLNEICYTKKGRHTIKCRKISYKDEDADPCSVKINSHSVFLVSGGARGITADCVIELAKKYQCNFVLLGRTVIEPEPYWAQRVEDHAVLKKKIFQHLQDDGIKPSPGEIDRVYSLIVNNRKINRTLSDIKESGGKCVYHSVDITQKEKLADVVKKSEDIFGKITGVIHGAGVLADKQIEKKTVHDFKKVYEVKVKGMENILGCVPVEQLDYIILFSSIAAFYGNIGQSDYALANETLNKYAYNLSVKFPSCNVLSINWGPWDGGMVTPELKKAFAERNIGLIPKELGSDLFSRELTSSLKYSQIIIGKSLVRNREN